MKIIRTTSDLKNSFDNDMITANDFAIVCKIFPFLITPFKDLQVYCLLIIMIIFFLILKNIIICKFSLLLMIKDFICSDGDAIEDFKSGFLGERAADQRD